MSPSPSTRRGFLRQSVGAAIFARQAQPSQARSGTGVLFEGYALPIQQKGVPEATLFRHKDGRYLLAYAEESQLCARVSTDRGRTWGERYFLQAAGGQRIAAAGNNPHISVFELKAGALGMIYCGPRSRPGRDGTLAFLRSTDRGETWSAPVMIDPVFSLCRSGTVRVLRSGRIAAPAFKWFSPYAGGESESADNGVCFSWLFYSDDEGATWRQSNSELMVAPDSFQTGVLSFEEPAVEERKDGSLLMLGRTETGRQYQSISKDAGNSWSNPVPLDVASSYAPAHIVRIPSTRDLLMVWNQSTTDEILSGLARHRLSTAISKDDGATWTSFRNLESLDDRARVDPPPAKPVRVYRRESGYAPPADRARYPHAPGCLRICYPTVVFDSNEVAIAYDYGYGPGEFEKAATTKIKVVTTEWLYAGV